MNAKHYVSLEVAKMLKQKGYNKETEYLQVDNPPIHKGLCINYLKPELCGGMKVDDTTAFPAPSLLEAIDWLEERGMHIEIRMPQLKVLTTSYKDKYKYEYYFVIYSDDTDSFPISEHRDGSFYLTYPDRYECMNAAIKKGLEYVE